MPDNPSENTPKKQQGSLNPFDITDEEFAAKQKNLKDVLNPFQNIVETNLPGISKDQHSNGDTPPPRPSSSTKPKPVPKDPLDEPKYANLQMLNSPLWNPTWGNRPQPSTDPKSLPKDTMYQDIEDFRQVLQEFNKTKKEQQSTFQNRADTTTAEEHTHANSYVPPRPPSSTKPNFVPAEPIYAVVNKKNNATPTIPEISKDPEHTNEDSYVPPRPPSSTKPNFVPPKPIYESVEDLMNPTEALNSVQILAPVDPIYESIQAVMNPTDPLNSAQEPEDNSKAISELLTQDPNEIANTIKDTLGQDKLNKLNDNITNTPSNNNINQTHLPIIVISKMEAVGIALRMLAENSANIAKKAKQKIGHGVRLFMSALENIDTSKLSTTWKKAAMEAKKLRSKITISMPKKKKSDKSRG